MLKQLSPGIVTNEVDIYYAQNDSSRQTNAAIVGDFNWGAVDTPIYVTNINQVIKTFTSPVDASLVSPKNTVFISAYNYLNYNSGGLWVTRSLPSNGYNAIADTGDINYITPGNVNYDTQFKANTTISVADKASEIELIANPPASLTNLHGASSTNTLYVFKEYERNKLLYSDDLKLGLDEKYYEQDDQEFTNLISSDRIPGEFDYIRKNVNYKIEASNQYTLDSTSFTAIKLYNTPNQVTKYTFATETTPTPIYVRYKIGAFTIITQPDYDAVTSSSSSSSSIKTDNIHSSTFNPSTEVAKSVQEIIPQFRSKLEDLKTALSTPLTGKNVAKFDLEWKTDSADVYVKIFNLVLFTPTPETRQGKYSFSRKSFSGGLFDSLEGFEYDDKGKLTDTPTNSGNIITFSGYFKAEASSKIVVLKMSNVDLTKRELASYAVAFDLNAAATTAATTSKMENVQSATSTANTASTLTIGSVVWKRLSITAKLTNSTDINLYGNNKFEVFYINTPPTWTTFPSLTNVTSTLSTIEFGGLQVENGNAPLIFQPKPLVERLEYIGNLYSVNTANSKITLTSVIDKPIEINDKIIIRNLSDFSKITIKSYEDFIDYSGDEFIIAKYPGEYGNSLKVIICSDGEKFQYLDASHRRLFNNTPPGTNFSYISKTGRDVNDEIYIIVVDEGGKFTGKNNTVLEHWKLSKAVDALNELNENIFYKDVINKKSNYILINRHLDDGKTWGNVYLKVSRFISLPNKEYSFKRGSGDTPTPHDMINSWRMISDPNKYALDVAISAGSDVYPSVDDNAYVIRNMHDIIENRKDCLMVVSPLNFITSRNPVNSIIEYFDALGIDSNKIVAVDNWKNQINPYTRSEVWVPLSADIAGLMARTDRDYKPWYSPAGYTRGKINNVKKLVWNSTKEDRDILYQAGINSVIFENGTGFLLFGDKTLTTKPTLFGKINVRRLFFALQKTISKIAVQNLFEFNDSYTRSTCKNLIDVYLSTVRSDRGLDDFLVVCDESNNTDDVINNSGFVVDVFARPTNSINFIQLNFINTPYGVNFNITE